MASGSAPGFVLGIFVVIGTVAAALAVRPRAGRTILPVPVLSYLVAALISGFIYNRSADSSNTALAIGAAQWVASGFVPMALAAGLAIVLVAVRWYLCRRNRGAGRDSGWPVRAGASTSPPRPGQGTFADSAYPASYQSPGGGSDSGGSGSTRPDQGPPGSRRGRSGPRPGSGPYNFSSGA